MYEIVALKIEKIENRGEQWSKNDKQVSYVEILKKMGHDHTDDWVKPTVTFSLSMLVDLALAQDNGPPQNLSNTIT